MKRIERDNKGGRVEDYHISDNEVVVNYQQDITKLLDDNKQKRNATSDWRKYDPNQEFHMVLDLSMTDVIRIKHEHGVDIMAPDVDWKYIFKLIETHYPYMKTTTARL